MKLPQILCSAALCLCLAGAALSAPAPPGILIDSYAAIVNGKVITVGDVLAALQPVQDRLAAQYQGRDLERRLASEYLAIRDALVETELILLDFETQGGTLPDRAIEDHINSVIHEQFNNDRAALLRALADERLTFVEWRKQMKDQLIVQIMRQREVGAKILVTPYDIQQAYHQNLAAYTTPERVQLQTLDAGASLADADALRDRILADNIAFDDAGTAAPPEWFDSADLHPALLDAIQPLQPNDITSPVELAGTFYLARLAQRETAQIQPLDETSARIENELRRNEFERLHEIWMDSLRAKYYVHLFSHDIF